MSEEFKVIVKIPSASFYDGLVKFLVNTASEKNLSMLLGSYGHEPEGEENRWRFSNPKAPWTLLIEPDLSEAELIIPEISIKAKDNKLTVSYFRKDGSVMKTAEISEDAVIEPIKFRLETPKVFGKDILKAIEKYKQYIKEFYKEEQNEGSKNV